MTIREAAAGLRARRFSAVELATTAMARIDRHDPSLRAFITITGEQALEQARQADRELSMGQDRGPLHGIPVALKDLFGTRGVRTTAGSKVYEHFVPERDATVVEKLAAAGAVVMGKLNMHELAYGITSANPHFGVVRNPWNPQHSPGGSSGGSGAAVATQMVFMAMGSDTGGSIRIPASFCGTVGLKPTYGRVSRFGVLPLGFSLDHAGPLTRSVRDAALTLNVIAGHDPRDPGSSRRPVVDFVPDEDCSIRGLRIGFPESFFFEHLHEDVESAVRGALARAESLGAVIKPVQLPDMAALNAIARIVLLSEASAVFEPYPENRSPVRRRRSGAARSGAAGAGHRLHECATPAAQDAPRIRPGVEGGRLHDRAGHAEPRTAHRRHYDPAGRPRRGCTPGDHAAGARRERARLPGAFPAVRTERIGAARRAADYWAGL